MLQKTALTPFNFVVIEKDQHMKTLVCETLAELGVRKIEGFVNLVKAVNHLRDFQADIIICEMDLEPMDGVSFARVLRSEKLPLNREAALLMTTSDPSPDRIKEAVSAGADNIALKPFSKADLTKRVTMTLKKHGKLN